MIMQTDGSNIRVFRDHKEEDTIYAYSKLPKCEDKISISVLKGNEQHFDDTNNSFFHTGWEQFLIQRNRLILHASLLNTQFGGLVFQDHRELENQRRLDFGKNMKVQNRLMATARFCTRKKMYGWDTVLHMQAHQSAM